MPVCVYARTLLPLLLPSPSHASQAPQGDSGLLWKAFLKHKHTIINAHLSKKEFLARGGKKEKGPSTYRLFI